MNLKKTLAPLFLTLCGLACTLNLKGQETFYQSDSIQEIRIVFEEPNWRHLLDSLFMNFGEDGRLGATVYINGQKFEDAGVRFKGYSSYDSSQVKNPFNIDLNYGLKSANYQGFQKLKLSNVIHDPSFVREALAYEIAGNYMPASRANFAMVYVNDVLLGLYTNVEAVDQNFIAGHFPTNGNTLFKGNPEVLEYPFGQNSNLAYTHGSDPSGYMSYYKLESSSGWNRIFNLIYVLNNDTANLADVLNIDRTLWMHAFNYSMINLDSYIGYSQNYYMYEDDNGCFNPILWDLNMSFGSFRETDDISLSLSIEKIKKLNPLQHLGSGAFSPRPLMKMLFLNSTYKRMYLAHLRTIMEEQFESGYYYTRAQQLQSVIDASVQLDSNKFYSYADFQLNIDTTTGPFSDQYPGLKNLMEARIAYLDTFPGIQGAPLLSQQKLLPERPALNQTCQINCKVQDASEVYMYYRTTSSGKFSRSIMYDDGTHNDYYAGDSIYGTTIISEGDILQYYFYAQNDSAGRFLPERAAYEYFTVYPQISNGKVVLNELKMISDGENADQDDEAEPWLELYNNSKELLQLKDLKIISPTDYFQSEKVLLEFPDTLMAPNSYMIVWLDGDSTQSGLHADNAFDESGKLILGYDTASVVDSLRFGYQSGDLSFGSYPNGSTSRAFLIPTFAAKNYQMISDSGHMILYPNPANDKLYILITPSNGYESVEIINCQMQQIMSISHGESGSGKSLDSELAVFNVSSLSEGIYFATIRSFGRSETVKFIIAR